MPTLLFKGFYQDGHRISGSRKYADEKSLRDYLDKQNITGYEIYTSETRYKTGMYSQVSPKELSIFCKQMSVLFYSHITLMEGILILAEQTENKQLQLALKEIHGIMEKGITFAESMRMYEHIFTSYLLNMIIIGETSGTLDTVFQRMSEYYDKESKMRKKLKSAITYPAILTTMMAAIVLLLILKILPMFNEILNSMGGEMPAITKLILGVSSFISNYLLIIAIVVAVLVAGFIYYISTDSGKMWFDKAKLRIPAFKYVNSRVVTARFSRSLSILIKSGVQLLNAMEDISLLMDNKYIELKFTEAVKGISQGRDLPDVLTEIGVFPVLFLKMIAIGQKTGNLDEMLDKSANVFDDEVDEAIEKITVMIEPILIIILSVVVGIILLSVMLPMISIMTTIG